ncbi:transmembrane and coiled-coil domain-containing protein 5B-like [Rhynchocyon petersi]
MEIPKLEVAKQNLDYLNSDLEKDLQRLDEANQILLRKIRDKEETIQSLERDLTLSQGLVEEVALLNTSISEKEEALRGVELETAKLEKSNETLSKKALELQNKERLQKVTEVYAKQEEELIKTESDYQSIYQLCQDQAYYIKKYQEILRKMEKEKEMMLLEKEVSKAQNNSSQILKPGLILVETIQSNMEKTIIKKHRRMFWFRHFRCLVFMIMIFIRLLGYAIFHLQYINPDLLADTLPVVMSRGTLKSLRDFLSPLLTLEVEEVLPH